MEILKVKEPPPFSLFGVDLGSIFGMDLGTIFGMDAKIVGLLILCVLFVAYLAGMFGEGSKAVTLEDASISSNPRVFFEIRVGGDDLGRIEMELFANICPKTAENFRC